MRGRKITFNLKTENVVSSDVKKTSNFLPNCSLAIILVIKQKLKLICRLKIMIFHDVKHTVDFSYLRQVAGMRFFAMKKTNIY